jgi:arylsulfatase A-like enzyme
MRRLAHDLGGLPAGLAVGGALVGAAEGFYERVPGVYASLLYAALWAAGGVVLALLTALLLRGRARAPRRLFVTGLALALGATTAVLVRFVLFRDVFAEAPGRAWAVTGLGVAAGLGVAVIPVLVNRILERTLASDQLGGAWQWLVPAVVIAAFALKTMHGDDRVGEEQPAGRPLAGKGVILVVADALRADALGVYGAGPHRGAPPSPALDGFAKDARVFTRATAQASWTRPAVASLLTSRCPSGHDTMAKNAVLPVSLPTLAGVLSEAGVRTCGVVTNYNLEPAYGFGRGFGAFHYLPPARYLGAPPEATRLAAYNVYRLLRERYLPIGREPRFFYRSGAAVNAEALAALDGGLGGGDFFLYLHYMEPHDPYFSVDGRSFARVQTPRPPLSFREAMRDAYRDGVRRFDDVFGQLLTGLRDRGLLEHTTIIVTADHGEELADHGGFWHGVTLYEEVLRLPLIMAGPGVTDGTDDALARQIDLAPTIVGLLAKKAPASWEGRDLFAPGDRPTISLAEEDHEGNRLRSLRVGDEKLVVANPDNPRGLPPVELFDLARDPRELAPVTAADAQARLGRALADEVAAARRGGARAAARPADATSEAELRSLGYVQ